MYELNKYMTNWLQIFIIFKITDGYCQQSNRIKYGTNIEIRLYVLKLYKYFKIVSPIARVSLNNVNWGSCTPFPDLLFVGNFCFLYTSVHKTITISNVYVDEYSLPRNSRKLHLRVPKRTNSIFFIFYFNKQYNR